MSRKIKVKIYKTTIMPVVLYGCETWSLTLRKQHMLNVFKNCVLRIIFGPKGDEVTVGGTFCTHGRVEKSTKFWWESQKERDLSEDRSVDGRMRLERILGRLAGGMWSGLIWLRVGTDDGLL
jgi:hypothetical protein